MRFRWRPGSRWKTRRPPLALATSAVVLATLAVLATARAGEDAGTNNAKGRLGLEWSPTFLLAPIYMGQATWSVWNHGDAIVGYAFQHMTSNTDGAGQTHGHTLLLGYRQFIWKGLHVELQAWPTYDRFQSYVDGRIYPGFELWCEAYAGYRFDFQLAGTTFYVMPQPGIGWGMYRSNKWPRFSDTKPFELVPQLILGARL